MLIKNRESQEIRRAISEIKCATYNNKGKQKMHIESYALELGDGGAVCL